MRLSRLVLLFIEEHASEDEMGADVVSVQGQRGIEQGLGLGKLVVIETQARQSRPAALASWLSNSSAWVKSSVARCVSPIWALALATRCRASARKARYSRSRMLQVVALQKGGRGGIVLLEGVRRSRRLLGKCAQGQRDEHGGRQSLRFQHLRW